MRGITFFNILPVLGAALLAAGPAKALAPRIIAFQGVARTAAGEAAPGPINVEVSLYDAPAAGALLFGPENHVGIPVGSTGQFQIPIGSIIAGGIPNSALEPAAVYVGVRINGDPEMTPRVRLASVPFVIRVSSAELDDSIDLGSSGASGGLRAFRNGQAQPTIVLNPSQHSIETYGDDGLMQTRLWGPSWGQVELYDNTGNTLTAMLSATFNSGGQLSLYSATGTQQVLADGGAAALSLYDTSGAGVIGRFSRAAAGALLETWASTGAPRTAQLGSFGLGGGALYLYQKDGKTGMTVDGDSGGSNGGGFLNLYAGNGTSTVTIDGQDAELAGTVALRNSTGSSRVFLDGQDPAGGGNIKVYNSSGAQTVELNGASHQISTYGSDGLEQIRLWGPSWGEILLNDNTGNNTTVLISAQSNSGGLINLYDADGGSGISMSGGSTAGSVLRMYNAAGANTITLDGDLGGDGRVITQELQITGGSDLSEQFTVNSDNAAPAPGMVVCIDPDNVGHLLVSSRAYDRTVAGVMSGAGGVKPGMLMGQKGSPADGDHPVALTGRVYVWCDASYGAIAAGDLLTTSGTPGHAMTVQDHAKAQGAILGKAMGSLVSGKGLVLTLVSLQ